MAEKSAPPQQPVISIRISEALRLRLETLKVLMSMKSGEPVSTSEAAKQLLESSKEERLELVNLLTEPTDSLLKIRRKADSRLPLSQAEWTLVAYYCLHGAETFANTAQTEISYESLAGILEAFQAVYGLLRKPKKTHLDSFFVAHLPPDRQAETKNPEEIGSEDVRRAVTHTIRMLKNPTEERQRPIFVARNLYFLLDELEFPNIEKLNEALWPYWPILWRVCARGHYFHHMLPLQDQNASAGGLEAAFHPPLPSFEEGEYRLEFVRSPSDGFSLWLSFPGRLAPRYPVNGYPRISEFRTILERLDVKRELIFWEGRYFLAYTWRDETDKIGVSFRARENGITFAFHGDDWQSIRKLFRRAWQAPEVSRLWDAQALEYGEL
ncbi:MAG: hypothetical protein ACHQIK_19755 [Candidatus Acidiferrales bacterium]